MKYPPGPRGRETLGFFGGGDTAAHFCSWSVQRGAMVLYRRSAFCISVCISSNVGNTSLGIRRGLVLNPLPMRVKRRALTNSQIYLSSVTTLGR